MSGVRFHRGTDGVPWVPSRDSAAAQAEVQREIDQLAGSIESRVQTLRDSLAVQRDQLQSQLLVATDAEVKAELQQLITQQEQLMITEPEALRQKINLQIDQLGAIKQDIIDTTQSSIDGVQQELQAEIVKWQSQLSN